MNRANKTQNDSHPVNMMSLVLTAIALAMGVVVVMLGVLGSATTEGLVTMLGIGLFALALNTLRTLTTPRSSNQ